jgi:filamentous hemagglutinin
MVGGADVAAANVMNTIASAGDVKISFGRTAGTSIDLPVSLVRTGTGSIDITAGRNVLLDTLDVKTGTLLAGNFSSSGAIAALQNDQLLGANIYTAGRITTLPGTFTAPLDNLNLAFGGAGNSSAAAFTSGGGGISINANGDVIGAVTNQLINNWLFRQGRATTNANGSTTFDTVNVSTQVCGRRGCAPGNSTPVLQNTAWWARPDYFNEGIATFGGGDIRVSAKGNVLDLSAAVATNAYLPGTGPVGNSLVEQGGGDLVVRAGGDIRGGTFYVQKGSGDLRAFGSVVAGDRVLSDVTAAGSVPSGGTLTPLHTVLALGDAKFNVTAGGDVQIESAFNPTMTAQNVNNVTSAVTNPFAASSTLPNQFAYFSTYSPQSAVRLTSVAGNILLSENANLLYGAGAAETLFAPTTATGAARPEIGTATDSLDSFRRFYLMQPGALQAAALGGSLSFQHGFSLAPAATGQLELLAQSSITAPFPKDAKGNGIGLTQPVVMIDRDPATLSTAASPRSLNQSDIDTLRGSATGAAFHTSGGLHANDPAPVRVIALDGNVDFSGNAFFPATIVVPKRAEIAAGADILNVGFNVQQLAASDVTTVVAGRDIIDSTNSTGTNPANIVSHNLTGPGLLDFRAGRNFDLGNSQGVVTRGNLDNPFLPDIGASINVSAGATGVPNYAAFANPHMGFGSLVAADYPALIAYMSELQPGVQQTLVNYIAQQQGVAANTLNWGQALRVFGSLNASAQASFSNAVWTNNFITLSPEQQANFLFFRNIVNISADPALSLPQVASRIDSLIATLYPASSINGGDINVFGSQIKTDRGGSITLFAPGGSVFAGLAAIPAYLKNVPASNLGVFTINGGVLQSFVKNDFLVNQGRVFTLNGGDVTLVSQFGNIDAGKGAKTAQSTPPPVLFTDQNGNTQIDISGSITGSGIATLRAGLAAPDSNVFAIAPRGIFDAGDAGVRSTGSVTINAAVVLNANNITAAGSVSGAPVGAATPAAPVAAPVNPNTTKADSFANSATAVPADAWTLSVELLGFAGDSTTTGSQQNVTQGGQN